MQFLPLRSAPERRLPTPLCVPPQLAAMPAGPSPLSRAELRRVVAEMLG